MATLTEMVATVVLQSSAAAFSHFGVVIDTPPRAEATRAASNAADQRTVARSPRPAPRLEKALKANCADPTPHTPALKA